MLKKVVLILIITLAIAIIGMTAAMFYFIKKNIEIKKNSLSAVQRSLCEGAVHLFSLSTLPSYHITLSDCVRCCTKSFKASCSKASSLVLSLSLVCFVVSLFCFFSSLSCGAWCIFCPCICLLHTPCYLLPL